MENILDRLFLFMAKEGLNPNKITVQAGLSVGLIGKAKKTNSGLNSDSIEKILHTYPNLSADWLLTGRGNMLIEKPRKTYDISHPTSSCVADSGYENNGERIKELEYIIELQKDLIQSLKNKLLDRGASGAAVADAS